jgi:hypothetical protein
MYCGGGHLGFPIDMKNIYFVEDLPMIIPGQFGFNCPSGFREEGFETGMKFKMAATAGLSLTLDPLRKMFQNASSLKPLGQLKPNCTGKVIGRSSTKFMFFLLRGILPLSIVALYFFVALLILLQTLVLVCLTILEDTTNNISSCFFRLLKSS